MIHDTLQSCGKELPLISIIIPVYNTQDYLSVCLQSVLNQTYQNFEIICVDDGSTDRSAEIIRGMMVEDPRIRLIQIENHGQGFARNLARKEANGKYILFLDADDYIEDVTLDLAVTRAETDESDFVVFDWYYFKPLGQEVNYCNHDAFFDKKLLSGDECLTLLRINPFFTVNKLYRRSFLDDNNIFYAEGHIYEDNPYWVEVVLSANCVSLIHSPLYRVTISKSSSTKTKTNTDFHYKSFISASGLAFNLMRQSTRLSDEDTYYLASYFFKRFLDYYKSRTPEQYRDAFLTEFTDLFATLQVKDCGKNPVLSFLLAHDVFSQKKYGLFRLTLRYYHKFKPIYNKYKKKIVDKKNRVKQKCKRIARKLLRKKAPPSTRKQKYESYLKLPVYEDVILFMGFDGRYTGNSRYLFDEMIKKAPANLKLFFVTKNPLVPFQYRIDPGSDRCDRFVARSKVVVFESWTPAMYKKRSGTVWIQLWHGTPLKKLLFDSNEETVLHGNPNQKTGKFEDIRKWDYLLADNELIASYFQTAFLFDKRSILPYGYPRVRFLKNNRDNEALKSFIKQKYGISEDRKILLYLPTWRDYNYKVKADQFDISYIPYLGELQAALGEEYEIVYKDHPFLSSEGLIDFKNYHDAETQELLLIADVMLTDYSSAIFDALAIDVPIVLFCNDFERNEKIRGVYPSVWDDVKPLLCGTEEAIPEAVRSADVDSYYKSIKRKYAYDEENSQDLGQFIINLF